MRRTVLLNVVGLTPSLIGEHTPRLKAFADAGALATVIPPLPAVTCTVQSTYLTGTSPNQHGIVGNGWYFRDECEIKFWRQSNRLVQRPKLWERARSLDPEFTCANMFWWYNMYSSVDVSATPRPMYPADGRKIPDVYTSPDDLRHKLQVELGQFPLFQFWGPATSIKASQWIADASRWVDRHYLPTLSLVYLPHLDYALQRRGPDDPSIATDLREIDAVCGGLIDHYRAEGVQIVILSEYGITPVSRPVHLNRRLRERGLIAVRDELGHEMLDPGASRAFAVADHQIAHIYVNDPSCLAEVRTLVEETDGVAEVLDDDGKRMAHLNHPRAGELVAVADPDAWFSYYFWLDDQRAPDFARTVEIHRKPGYDPVELFIDPSMRLPKAQIGLMLLKRTLGFRTLLEVVPLDASLVRGSHGRVPTDPLEGPVFVTERSALREATKVPAAQVHDLVLKHLRDGADDDPAAIHAV